MAERRFYWLKLKRDFFKRHDIRIIEAMPNGKDYILFYLKLLCESVDHEGNLRFSEHIPYSTEMLATITDTNVDIVRSAIKVFCELNMMEVLDDGTFFMTEVNRMIGSAADNDNANRQRRFRERQKEAALLDRYGSVTRNNESKSIEIDIEKETETDIYARTREEPLDLQWCMDLWNDLKAYGIKPVIDITGTRYQALKDVLQLYGEDGYKDAIEKIRASQFLQGHNDKSWVVTFDWFLKNFARVLEGQFDDKSKMSSGEGDDEIAAAIRGFLER